MDVKQVQQNQQKDFIYGNTYNTIIILPITTIMNIHIYRLKSTGTAAGQRAGVVRAIAEKLNIMLPGI